MTVLDDLIAFMLDRDLDEIIDRVLSIDGIDSGDQQAILYGYCLGLGLKARDGLSGSWSQS